MDWPRAFQNIHGRPGDSGADADSGLLYQRLVAEGVLRERGAQPPVLPVVIYNGLSLWTAGRGPGGWRRAATGQPGVGAAGHVDRAVAGAGRRGVDGRVQRLGPAGAAAVAAAGNGLSSAIETGGGAHDAGGNYAGLDRAVGRAGPHARDRARNRAAPRRGTRAAVSSGGAQVRGGGWAAVGRRAGGGDRSGPPGAVRDWIIECGPAAELFARLADTPRRSQ